jgi:carbonic anhydrase
MLQDVMKTQTLETPSSMTPSTALQYLKKGNQRFVNNLKASRNLGDVFSICIAGNVVITDIIGSIEFACKVAGSRLIVVLGHSKHDFDSGTVEFYANTLLSSLADRQRKQGG